VTEQLLWSASATALLAFLLVGLVRAIAERQGVLDHPTDRSSHSVPTPRGGGLGLLLPVLGMCGWRAAHARSWDVLATLIGVAVVASLGWADDRRGLAVRVRLTVHVLAACGVGLLALNSSSAVPVRIALFAWWTFWTVSSVNLVNFMDGINGLVASQIAVFAFSLAFFPARDASASYYAMVVASACVGFLPWNFPRARIFLGDVGSGGLGYLVPVLALLTMRSSGIDIVRAHLPLFALFGDATWTFLRRWRNGERVTEAHRSHLYQRLANGGMGHAPVTMIYAFASLCGAVAAHADRYTGGVQSTIAFLAATVLAGVLLDRRANRATRAWM
jgi:UDP-N-acetylmuramyl pentapeptide phosphotransferase/UDP-N-acetylglucosamine-1-phosphate transferase